VTIIPILIQIVTREEEGSPEKNPVEEEERNAINSNEENGETPS